MNTMNTCQRCNAESETDVCGRCAAYVSQIEAKRDRYEERAEKASAESESRMNAFSRVTGNIPLGQPILIGHHSEKRHRKDIERAKNNLRKSMEAADKAKHYASKAESYGTHGIASHDPAAVAQLKQKIAGLESNRDEMKRINAIFRKGGWDAVSAEIGPEQFRKLISRVQYQTEQRPFPSYALTNLGSEIRRAKQRIAELEAKEASRPGPNDSEETIMDAPGKFVAAVHHDLDRVAFDFPGKPAEAVRSVLKSAGFRWAPSLGMWTRKDTPNARAATRRIAEQIAAL